MHKSKVFVGFLAKARVGNKALFSGLIWWEFYQFLTQLTKSLWLCLFFTISQNFHFSWSYSSHTHYFFLFFITFSIFSFFYYYFFYFFLFFFFFDLFLEFSSTFQEYMSLCLANGSRNEVDNNDYYTYMCTHKGSNGLLREIVFNICITG